MSFKNKRRIALLIVVALLALIMPATSAAPDYRTIRVRITMASTNVNSVSIKLNGDYMLVQDPELALPSGDYTIAVAESADSGKTLRLTGEGIDAYLGSEIRFIRMKYSGTSVSTLRVRNTYHGDINYLGDMRFNESGGNILVTNHVPMEQYLYGVVAYEMSNSFPLEALKAQAVSARGYAIKKITTSGDYDIGDTASTQVYKGYNPSYTKVIQAVDETKGKVATYADKIITTYYAASNGGQTELISNVWGGSDSSYPYLVQKDDPYDLRNPSSMVRRAFAPNQVAGSKYDSLTLGQVVRVINVSTYLNIRSDPSIRSDNIIGKAYLNEEYEYLETDQATGWHKIVFYEDGILKVGFVSNTYSVVEESQKSGYLYANPIIDDLQQRVFDMIKDAQGISQVDFVKINQITRFENGQKRWPDTDSRSYVTANADVLVQYLDGEGTLSEEILVENVSLDLLIPTDSGYTSEHPYLNKYLRMRGVEASLDADENAGYDIVCLRYGHGVGMSQRGAQQMAAEGKSYEEIIAFYFEGTTLKTYETTVPELPSRGEETLPEAPVPIVTSTVYTIGVNSITGISENTTVETFLQNFVVKDGTLSLATADNNEKTEGTVLTGDVLHVKDNNGEIAKTYSITVTVSEEETVPSVTSTVYEIGTDSVTGISENTTVETFLQNFVVKDGTLSLATADNNEKTEGTVLTGDILHVKDNNGEISKTYSVTVTVNEEETPSETPTPTVESSEYTLDSESMTGIDEKTPVATFMQNLQVKDGTVNLIASDNKSKTTGNLATGDMLQVKDIEGEIVKTYTILIFGDVNGDGEIDIFDITAIRRHILGIVEATGVKYKAANITGDSTIDIFDLTSVRRHILGIRDIQQ